MNKKVFIKTFGCQMNEYDSNRIYDAVKAIGYNKTENQDEADCYILTRVKGFNQINICKIFFIDFYQLIYTFFC